MSHYAPAQLKILCITCRQRSTKAVSNLSALHGDERPSKFLPNRLTFLSPKSAAIYKRSRAFGSRAWARNALGSVPAFSTGG